MKSLLNNAKRPFKDRLFSILSSRKFSYLLVVGALLSGLATYLVITNTGSVVNKTKNLLPFIYLDLTFLLLLALVITRRLIDLWHRLKKGELGSKIHTQLAVVFALFSMAPTIFVSVFSGLFLNIGLESWFSKPVKESITQASSVAKAYLEEHKKGIKLDAQGLAIDLRPQIEALLQNKKFFSRLLTHEANSRNLSEVLIFNGQGDILVRSYLTFALQLEKIMFKDFKNAQDGNITIKEMKDRVRAIIQLDKSTDTYLFIGKIIDQKVLDHLEKAKNTLSNYSELELQRSGYQLTFLAFYGMVALLLLLSSIWFGLSLANYMAKNISKLIKAVEKIGQGEFETKIPLSKMNNEVDILTNSVNTMGEKLQKQHENLLHLSEDADKRRHLIETILSNISAGVMTLDEQLNIILANPTAVKTLQLDQNKIDHYPLNRFLPDIAIMAQKLENFPNLTSIKEQIPLTLDEGTYTLQAILFKDPQNTQTDYHYILTFEDVSDLIQAQKKAAWSDVARKIAHEIKNPLTPIQLSAERLKRKYLKHLGGDTDVFEKCIDTITRQVNHIGQLVKEFSGFARMPAPQLEKTSLNKILKNCLHMEQMAHNHIHFDNKLGDEPFIIKGDTQQLSQAFTNILQNAVNILIERDVKKPKIRLSLESDNKNTIITIEDNGPGFPKENRDRLLEPYFTTREKGTGLGLAIVSKIISDHFGDLSLGDSPHLGGAMVKITLPDLKP